MNKYMCDFETSTEQWLARDNGVARVWASCIVTIDENPKLVMIDNNIDSFMQYAFKLGNCELYFHNLAYDGEYIISWLFDNGYRYSTGAKKPKTFDCVIADSGLWYAITITHKVFNKRYVRTHIYDSLKKIPLKVSVMAKAFNLPESKGTIDYNLYRPIGYQLSDNDKDYIVKDCMIPAKSLWLQFNKKLNKMTVGSDAMSYFKNTIGGQKAFDYLFPTLPLDVDNDIRLSYRGGFTMVNPKYKNKIVDGISFDVNSLYPSVMYGNMGSLPYGKPKYYNGKYVYDERYPLYIQKFSCEFKLKENMIPTIQLKNNLAFIPTEYIEDSNGIVDLVLTSPDMELFFEHYDVWNIEYVGGYKFQASSTLFRPYIDYWMNIKANSKGGLRQLAKLMLNSLYGKFATNPRKQNKIPTVIDDNIVMELGEVEYNDPIYTAMASFITARARGYAITTAQVLHPHWVYTDTDSCYLTGITEEEVSKYINIHPSNLGAWKLEHHFTKAKFLRPKTYIMNSIEDGLTVTCSGMPDTIKLKLIDKGIEQAFEQFTYGASFTGKLSPKRVKGGVVLCEMPYSISNDI